MTQLVVLHVLGIDDTDRVQVFYLSPDRDKAKHFYAGNVDFEPLLDRSEFAVFQLVCGGMAADQVQVPKADVILNSVCDADTNKKALEIVLGIERQLQLQEERRTRQERPAPRRPRMRLLWLLSRRLAA